ncbi:(2Fe-2S)-binding protein [Natrinema versiforme]|uniref:(2Fe-2S)-binding protein n=1 Tax=Natrinema versiforme TaxID=88724 RepID=A0A4P8WLU5_9EURY|nr:(2Fe-2S)-binding protein [Natrinema versiforme]QCS44548.1 (2Fe-2S)-binding protein [Natrinema versiforme]
MTETNTNTESTTVSVTVNGEEYTKETEDRTLLVHFLREELGLTGTHQGCVVGKCGACTVLHEGTPKKSCMLYAAQVDGDEITTVEGLADVAESEGVDLETRDGTTLHPLQMGFKQNHGLQCGFCTPGFLMTSYALLQENENPTREDIKSAISGNICRCTGYNSIVDSVEWASKVLQEGEPTAMPDGGPETGCGCGCTCVDDESVRGDQP